MKLLLAALAITTAGIAAPAYAAPHGYARTFSNVETKTASAPRKELGAVVNFSDLDLSRPADALKMYDRLETAARTACRSYARRAPASLRIGRQHRCAKIAVADAVARLQAPAMTAIHADRNERRFAGLLSFGG